MDALDRGARLLRVLALSPHPVEGPGPRHRVLQYLPHLERHGISVEVQTFFDSAGFQAVHARPSALAAAGALARGTWRRMRSLTDTSRYDLIFIYLWLHPFTFPPVEWLLRSCSTPVLYDIDDPYYVPLGSRADPLRDKGWLTRLMEIAELITVGSDPMVEFARRFSPRVEVLPTPIDMARFCPRAFDVQKNTKPVIGWVGSPHTAHHLNLVFPALLRLAKEHEFVVRLTGAGRDIQVPGLVIENQVWTLENEVKHFQELDIGLYPLVDDSVIVRTKHGFKLYQYMSVEVPAVVSAVGMNPGIVEHGVNALLARSTDDWYENLSRLLTDYGLRRRIGQAGRRTAEARVSLERCVPRLASFMREAAVGQRLKQRR